MQIVISYTGALDFTQLKYTLIFDATNTLKKKFLNLRHIIALIFILNVKSKTKSSQFEYNESFPF